LRPGQVHDHSLIGEERLEAPLRDLRLIRGVRGVPAGVFQDVALNDRRRERGVIAEPDERPEYLVGRYHRAELSEDVVLGTRPAGPEGALEANLPWHHRVNALGER